MDMEDLMLLSGLHSSLMWYANERLQILPGRLPEPNAFGAIQLEERITLREALFDNLDLIDDFIDENPVGLEFEELKITRSWKRMVFGQFWVVHHLKEHSAFFLVEDKAGKLPPAFYAVRPLGEPLENVIGTQLPRLVEALLLPFKGVIIYDGVLCGFDVSADSGLRKKLKSLYRSSMETDEIIVSLDGIGEPSPQKAAKSRSAKTAVEASPKSNSKDLLKVILELTDKFCRDHLNHEYATMCQRLASELSGRLPSPFQKGTPESWACGIVRAIGFVNFLHDKTQQPFMRAQDIDRKFGVSSSTASARLNSIRGSLGLVQMDPEWTLPSRIHDNPLFWLIELHGLLIDVRTQTREFQERVFNAGLIPYIHADGPP